ncbi:MAG TPA: phenylalanine--tRNA ligase subunit beta [Gammaproteobacteria bacterium]
MRVNIEWLRDWVDISIAPDELAEKLTIAGLEVDSVEAAAPPFEGIVVAEIVGVEPHPDADRLLLCRVNDGSTEHSVVCGAPNAARGLRAPFAPVGATMPGGSRIKPAKLRGRESQGMLCSAQDLGLEESSDGLLELPADAPIGESLRDYMRLDDAVLDIDLTPNRGDCFSVLGIAREIAATQSLELRLPVRPVIVASNDATFDVRLEAGHGCPRFVGRAIRGIDAEAESPAWMVERLRRVGLRPIHPVVDVTNFVMLELGQPLHSYDLSKLDTAIVVRFAEEGEKLILLDGREVELDANVMVIADGSGPIGLAGIMGGASTGVTRETRNVFLEAAFFSPDAIAGRAREFGLHTDASMRFERGVDPERQTRAIERATELILDIAGGDAGPLTESKLEQHLSEIPSISLRHERLRSVLGLGVSAASVESCLESLGMQVDEQSGGWKVVPPSFRFDVRIEEDLIEEVARMIGYDNIPVTPELRAGHLGLVPENNFTEERLADLMAARGYSEIISYSFVDEELELAVNPGTVLVKLANPISRELSVLRRSLWPGLLKTASQNLNRQQPRLRLFEMGVQFAAKTDEITETRVVAGLVAGSRWPENWDLQSTDADIFDVKADLEAVFEATGNARKLSFTKGEHPALMPGQTARVLLDEQPVGWLGSIHPALQARLDLKTPIVLFAMRLDAALTASIPTYDPYSKFPSVRRDLAILVETEVTADKIEQCVRTAAGEMLQNVMIFDVYRGERIDSRLKSVALGLILQHTSRTLTDADADQVVSSVTEHLWRVLGARIRT